MHSEPLLSKPSAKTSPYADAPRLPEQGPIRPLEILGASQVELELGPGRGGFAFQRLAAEPSAALIGLEIRRKWATIVDNRLKAQGLGARGRIFAEDAKAVLPRWETGSVSNIFIHFPDPWWKKRHQKRLLLSPELIEQLCRVLTPGGHLFVQTDVEERAQAYEAMLREAPALGALGSNGPWLDENPFRARSPREERAMRDGLPIFRLCYVRKHV